MKKTLIVLLAAVCILLSACGDSSDDAIDELNQNTNLPYPLTLPENDLHDTNGFRRQEAFGGYIMEKEGIMFWVSGWPDVSDSFHVSEYQFTSTDYHVFGISVGDTIVDAERVLEDHGYKRTIEENNDYVFTIKNRIDIVLHLNFYDEDKIEEIWVTASTTNKDDIVF